MRKAKASNVIAEQQNWEKIFYGMVHMLHSQQQQLLSLASERKLLDKDNISELKGISIYEEKRRLLDGAKADWLLDLKQREVSILNYIRQAALLSHQKPSWFD
ncbi:hypothetical protein QN277_023429 [Acacia crassicarpa]|uniref:Uncharacterized protein n=1 Tax=Acacia crassicarpa TaxID=499986 RepID=A0AAE1JK46_9FABA|nr:hypothetical protein QN277_023429 [Acacia crassicarpa]